MNNKQNSKTPSPLERAGVRPAANKDIFVHNLNILLAKKQVTITDLAEGIGSTVQRIQRWTDKICFPKYDCMILLCQYFDYYDIYKLLTEKIE